MYVKVTYILFQFTVDLPVGLCNLHQDHTYEDKRSDFYHFIDYFQKREIKLNLYFNQRPEERLQLQLSR